MAEMARLYWDNASYRAPIWYQVSATGESANKQGLVKEILLNPITVVNYSPLLGKNAAFYDISITYQETYEDRGGSVIVNSVSMSSLGGKQTISAISGSWPARIHLFQFGSVAVGNPIYKCWAGIKPTGAGVGSFNPVWEVETIPAGQRGLNTAVATDANGGPGGSNNILQCTFGTATLAQRLAMTVDDACADSNYDQFAGRYNVLLRCRMTADSCNVLMKSGYGTALAPAEYKTVNWTSFKFVSIGEILIPPMGNYLESFVDASIYRTFSITVWAERVTGAGSLNMDCLVLIPADHFTYNIGSSIENNAPTNHLVFEDGKHTAISLNSSGSPNAGLQFGFRGWEVPIGGGALVVAGERSASQVRGDNFLIYMAATHRHRHYND
jgi:hypothetical protein